MEETKSTVTPQGAIPIPDLDKLPKAAVSEYKLKEAKEDAEREIAMNPGKYTPEKIRKWRELGIARPEFIPVSDWKMADDTVRPIERIICHLSAIGMENKDIAKSVGRSESYVRNIVHSQTGEREIERIQDKVWGKSFKQTIEDVVPIAIQTAVKVMLDPSTKGSTKVAAAFAFMDRHMGKPTQTVEVSNNMLKQVYEMLDAQGSSRPVIDVPSGQETPALTEPQSADTVKEERTTPNDPIDSWVEENL